MKRTVTKLVSLLLVTVMCFSALPLEVFAWGKMTHVYTANLVQDDLFKIGAGSTTVRNYNYAIPEEFLDAIRAYPDAFRAGALGPDMYPDILTGQMYIHPEDENIDSGEWVTYLCNAVNKMGKDTEGRKICLAFTLGCMLHYCGDLFGHDFVNTFSGGAFPSVASLEMLDITSERLNNVMSHLSVEKYMDTLLYPTYDEDVDGGIDAPDQFVRDAMIFDGTPGAGLVPLYEEYPETMTDVLDKIKAGVQGIPIVEGIVKNIIEDYFDEDGNNVPPHYTAMLALRSYVTETADEYRENMEPVSAGITMYCDYWAEDIDRGINAFVEACDNIAKRLITREKNPVIEAKKEEEREKEKNQFWDMSGYNLDSFIDDYYPEDVARVKADLEEAELYGDSFFDMILMELILKGVITIDMVKTDDSSIMIIKEELSYWMNEYAVYMLGIPDIIIDGIEIPVIGDFMDMLLLKPLWSWIAGEIKNLAAEWVVNALTGTVSTLTGWAAEDVAQEINSFVSSLDDRLEDPKLQLDHPDNPYKPSKNNFADFNEYMDHLAKNKPEEFEALYNTLVMFRLVLMGPENYSQFISAYAAGAKQTSYQTNTAHLEASALRFRIRTSDLYLAGTDGNVYVIVYKKIGSARQPLTSKLLDKSGYNDFEQGDDDEYLVELPEPVKLDEIEISVRKTPAFDFLPGITDDWHCENITVMPMYAGYDLITAPEGFDASISLGGIHVKGVDQIVRMNFSDAIAVLENRNQESRPVTNLDIEIQVKDALYAGTDDDIYVVAYNGDKEWIQVCLDLGEGHDDLEKKNTEIYNIPVGKNVPGYGYQGIPLDQLIIKIKHPHAHSYKYVI